jgi:hypothetical protein
MILADTSVWIDHLVKGEPRLIGLLVEGDVAVHPFVVGELACGNLGNRQEILSLLRALPEAPRVENTEVLDFIERHELAGRGLGLVDVHLLASCQLGSQTLWTKDKRLETAAEDLDLTPS